MENGNPESAPWGGVLTLTGLVTSMTVNVLMTGLIVFKILRVFMEVKSLSKATTSESVEQTLGSLSSTGGPKLQRIIFVIIESGMALFAIQLIRLVISILIQVQESQAAAGLFVLLQAAIIFHQMLNVITILLL